MGRAMIEGTGASGSSGSGAMVTLGPSAGGDALVRQAATSASAASGSGSVGAGESFPTMLDSLVVTATARSPRPNFTLPVATLSCVPSALLDNSKEVPVTRTWSDWPSFTAKYWPLRFLTATKMLPSLSSTDFCPSARTIASLVPELSTAVEPSRKKSANCMSLPVRKRSPSSTRSPAPTTTKRPLRSSSIWPLPRT